MPLCFSVIVFCADSCVRFKSFVLFMFFPLTDFWALWGQESCVSQSASLVAQMVKNLPAMWETRVQSLGWEDPLEEGMATHSSILTWRIPWKEEPGGLQSMGSQTVKQNRATRHSTCADVSVQLASDVLGEESWSRSVVSDSDALPSEPPGKSQGCSWSTILNSLIPWFPGHQTCSILL